MFDGELIEGHIGIDCGDHPIAVGPHDARSVDGKSIGIRIASLIEPEPPPAFAELRASEQIFDQAIYRVQRTILADGLDLLGAWEGTDEIQVETPHERGGRGARGTAQALLVQFSLHPSIDRVGFDIGYLIGYFGVDVVFRNRQRRTLKLRKRPMLFIACSLGDPASQDLFLRIRKGFIERCRGHEQVGILAMDPTNHFALVGPARDDRTTSPPGSSIPGS